MIDLNLMVQAAYRLEPLPTTVVRLARLVAAPEPDLPAIGRTVALDPVLAATLIRLANSVAYGGRGEIVSIDEAVVRVGTSIVLALAVGCSARRTLDQPLPEYGLDEGRLWTEACAGMLAAERLQGHCARKVPAEAPTAALLRDIGKLVMGRFLSPQWVFTLEVLQREMGASQQQVECEVLGVHHAEVGGLIASRWKLPDLIATAITFHHEPAAGGHPICDAVHVADAVASMVQGGHERLPESAGLDAGALERLGMPASALEALARDVGRGLDEIQKRFGVASFAGR